MTTPRDEEAARAWVEDNLDVLIENHCTADAMAAVPDLAAFRAEARRQAMGIVVMKLEAASDQDSHHLRTYVNKMGLREVAEFVRALAQEAGR